MDAQTIRDAGIHRTRPITRVVAADGDPLSLHRPGFRVPQEDTRDAYHRDAGCIANDAIARQQVLDAREQYLGELTNAWRNDASQNPSKGPSDEEDDDDDEVSPRRRRKFTRRSATGREEGTVEETDALVRYVDDVRPGRAPVDELSIKQMQDAHDAKLEARVHDGTGDSDLAMHRPGFRVTDAPLSDELQHAHDAYERDLTTAWRRGAEKDDVMPDARKALGNDGMPVDDIETAYRLYCEEISQAWKTPR
jgi:hypothetical protein